jgi:hypothetical protein
VDRVDDRVLGRAVAAGRVVFGLAMLFAPGLVLRSVAEERPGPLVWMCRAFGIRDVVLGAGALRELAGDDPGAAARWVEMGAVADSTDTVAALVWRRELGWSGTLATWALAVPAALAGFRAAAGLRRAAAPPAVPQTPVGPSTSEAP